MGIEIDRKFLIANDQWRNCVKGIPFAQGYLARGSGRTVRVRIAGDSAYLTIKGPVTGISRSEFEYSIPLEDARELLKLCEDTVIKKTRHRIPFEGHIWEVDEFHAENTGLVIAEVEMEHADEPVSLPIWVGKEVTGDPRFYNSNLSVHPYSRWNDKTR